MVARTRPRKAFVIHDPEVIEPLGTPAADAWLMDGPIRAWQERLFASFGLTTEPVATLEEAAARAKAEGGLVTYDSIVGSRAVVRRLLEAYERGTQKAITAALPEGLATRRLSHISGLEPATIGGAAAFSAPLHVVAPGADLADAELVLLPYKESELKFPTPMGMFGRSEASFGISDAVLVRVSHWAHLLRVNLSMFLAGWVERWQSPLGRLWFLWRALLAFPWRGDRLGMRIRRVHRKAKIHHRACVEGSIVEEGAVIGANAVVKYSWIGRGARIDDCAIVNASVVGAGGFVAQASTVFNSLICPGAFAAQERMQFSVLGENSVAFTDSGFFDLNFERNVQVRHRGATVDAGDRFLGVCLGPWARVAGGVYIGSGRSVPAGALIIQPPEWVLLKIDPDLASTRRVTVAGSKAVDAGPLPPRSE